MSTHITTPRQFRLYGAVLAMAALLAVLLAVTLTAGTTQAQVGIGPGQLPRLGDNADEYSEYGTLPCTEETEPADSDVAMISDGYYAVFDGFWDYEDGHLSNNFCPPKVTVTEGTDPETLLPTTVYTRTDANIHISKTAFSIPDSYKVTVVDSRPETPAVGNPGGYAEGTTIDIADFPFLAKGGAVSAVKTKDGETVFANNTLWWVRLDDPGTTANDTSPLQIGFSTDLLEEADWYKADGPDKGTELDPPVRFLFDSFHVFKDGRRYKGEEAHKIGAHIFAFDRRTEDTALQNAQWSSFDTDVNEVQMFTGEYRQMQFAFTQPGSYLVQVNFKGHVRNTRDPAPADGHAAGWTQISPDDTITSPVQWYTFHVGPQAELDVALTAGAVSTTDGASTVPITVTANNSGPDAAQNVEVEINLPPGLSAPSTLPSGVTSTGCGVMAWKIGTLASGSLPPLTFNATVDTGASGKVTATAEIRSTTFDPDLTNNAASAETTLSGTNVRAPFFPGVSRSIVEHAVGGAHAGDPVAAESPDGRALSYSLSGPCSNKFLVHSNGQIALAANQTLDYEKQWEYPLTLHVSDGVNASGAADTSADDSIPVLIEVIDTADDAVHPTVNISGCWTLRSNRFRDLTLTANLSNAPPGVEAHYTWYEQAANGGYWEIDLDLQTWTSSEDFADGQTRSYKVHVKWGDVGFTAVHEFVADNLTDCGTTA